MRPGTFRLAAIMSIVLGCCSAFAQSGGSWPDKPVRLIVGAAAGGPTDVVARIVANELAGALGQAFVVDNRPGAGHQIGMTAMANAESDGYTLGVVTTPFVVNPAIYKRMPYDTKDLQPISLIASSPLVLVVHPAVPATTVGELVALAKAKPSELNMASAGNITGPHLAGELFRSMAGIKVQHVAYRGGPQATTAIIRGEAHFYFDTPSSVMPHVESGAVRALAHTFPERIPQLHGIPTVAESGFPGFEFHVWTGIVAPAAVPKDIVQRMERELRGAVQHEGVRNRLIAAGFIPIGTSSSDFAVLIEKELAKWKRVAQEAGIAEP